MTLFRFLMVRQPELVERDFVPERVGQGGVPLDLRSLQSLFSSLLGINKAASLSVCRRQDA
jgi:hypothetical protein